MRGTYGGGVWHIERIGNTAVLMTVRETLVMNYEELRALGDALHHLADNMSVIMTPRDKAALREKGIE